MAELDPAFVHRLESPRERLAQLAVDGAAVRDSQELLVELPQLVLRYGRFDARAAGAVKLAGAGRCRVRVVPRVVTLAKLVVPALECVLPLVVGRLDCIGG